MLGEQTTEYAGKLLIIEIDYTATSTKRNQEILSNIDRNPPEKGEEGKRSGEGDGGGPNSINK